MTAVAEKTAIREPTLRFTGNSLQPSSLDTLTADEKQLVTSFRDSVPTIFPGEHSPAMARFLADDLTLYRYLQGEKWNLGRAQAALQKTIAWRDENGVDSGLRPEDVEKQSRGKTNYFNGFDRHGRPLMYIKKRNDKGEELNFKMGIQLMVLVLETAIAAMPNGVHQLIIILDFTLSNQAQPTPFSVAIETLRILTTHYPERLARACLVNAPTAMRLSLNLIWPFMDERTKSKIKFVNAAPTGTTPATGGSKTGKNDLLECIEAEALETTYGGTLEFEYNHDVYWQKAREEGLVQA
ncbi:CRAL-TRIO domain-containing protein [Jimgerdemannia flammicorona]|uniref:CRAL-TRIO domain-containing protein n=1 Tax=Jimgerdemannia flammicorona TaxID=994334 RepID=A0A433QVR1_9FUNG|nr:CRAL-TRIO domain-containing protein [Jimgerdemannia flammicorona]